MKNIALILLFVGLLIFYYKSLITQVVERKINDPVKEDINNNVLIHQMLNNLMMKYKADRGYIFQFSNSIMYYDNTHRNHTNMSFEVCAYGISYEGPNLQNLPVSLFPNFLQEVMLDRMIYSDIKDIKETSTYIALNRQGIKSVYIAPYFKDGKFVAYIGLDFVRSNNNCNFDYKEFKNLTNEIGNILVQ
jgi:hypothetical protein